MGQRANLDILRSVAVGAVLFSHLLPTLQTVYGADFLSVLSQIGHAGVIVFFVHTSLVLMYSLQRMHSSLKDVTWRFYVRRIFRIYPLAIFAIILVVACRIPAGNPPGPVTGAAILSNLLLVQNLVVKRQVLAPLWSLPYEVQMYAVLPFLFLVARKKRASLFIGGLVFFFCLVAWLLNRRTEHLNLLAYVPCFLSGVLCYTLRKTFRPLLAAYLWPPLVLALVFSYCYLNRSGHAIWGDWALALMIGPSINCFVDSRSGIFNRSFSKVALYSYGIYLLHVPVLYFVFTVMQVRNLPAGIALYLALTGAASVATFHAIEAPMVELGRRLSSPGLPGTTPEPSSAVPAP